MPNSIEKMNAQKYEREQLEMLKKLEVLPNTASIGLTSGDKIVTLDVQYKGEWGYVGLDLLTWEGNHQVFVTRVAVKEEYEPGFFAFREGPVLKQALEKLIAQLTITPSLLIIDGHGTAHPRKMGLASWLGIKMDIPSIGVAKETLLKFHGDLNEETGSTLDITHEGATVGKVLRTQKGIKPVFVSAGHKISQREAIEIIIQLRGEYRNIEPIRRADQAARRFAKTGTADSNDLCMIFKDG